MDFRVFTFFIFVTVTIVTNNVSSKEKSYEEVCAGDMKCLLPSQCGELDYDLIYECGMNGAGFAKVCCVPKKKTTSTKKGSTVTTTTTTSTTESNVALLTLKNDLLPKKEDCGSSDISDRIANGKNASIGQFPWMALLGYTTKKITYPQYYCGGTLITDRYILTAAHCTKLKTMKLSVVRLGELNLETEVDCQREPDSTEEYCAPKPLDMPVEKLITHENYNNVTLKNDIALIRLAEKVPEFNDYIRPVCLPFDLKADDKFIKNKSMDISGWGKTITSSVRVSSVLQYTTVKGWDSKRCMNAIPRKVWPINGTQVCATGANLTEACKGDSGGPLTLRQLKHGDTRTFQVGIVSFKALDTCGSEELPTVFTRVDSYLDWILSHLEP